MKGSAACAVSPQHFSLLATFQKMCRWRPYSCFLYGLGGSDACTSGSGKLVGWCFPYWVWHLDFSCFWPNGLKAYDRAEIAIIPRRMQCAATSEYGSCDLGAFVRKPIMEQTAWFLDIFSNVFSATGPNYTEPYWKHFAWVLVSPPAGNRDLGDPHWCLLLTCWWGGSQVAGAVSVCQATSKTGFIYFRIVGRRCNILLVKTFELLTLKGTVQCKVFL